MEETLDRGRKRIQELRSILEQNITQQEQVNALVELAWEYRMSQPEQASDLSECSSRLSQTGEFASEPYARGLAGSLINMAFVETYTGKLDTAFAKCLQALSLLNQELPSATMVDACAVSAAFSAANNNPALNITAKKPIILLNILLLLSLLNYLMFFTLCCCAYIRDRKDQKY